MTQILPGQLLYVFGASILDAALLSWLALLWYRRSVNRLMRETPPDAVAGSVERHDSSVPSRSVAPPIEPGELKLAEERPEALPHTAAVPRPGTARVIVAYSLGAAAFAAVITAVKFWTASPPLLAVAWLVDWWTNLWPVVPTLVALLVLDRRDRPAPRASLCARRRNRHLSVHRGRAASQRHAQHRAAHEYLLGRRQPRVDGIDPVRGHRPYRLAARARGHAARPGRHAALRLRLDAVPRVARSRVERRVVQGGVSQRRRVLVT